MAVNNQTILIGRLTKDPDTRMTASDLMIASFTLAVNRHTKEKEADFITCKAFGKTAENIAKFFRKGSLIGVAGRIQTGKYQNKDGHTVYTTDVIVNEFEFLESKKEPSNINQFSDLQEVDGSDIPF